MKNALVSCTIWFFAAVFFSSCQEELPLYQIEIETTDGGVTTQGSAQYVAGTELSVTAVPDENYEFKEWTGSIISTENPLSIKVCQGERIIANFVLKNP